MKQLLDRRCAGSCRIVAGDRRGREAPRRRHVGEQLDRRVGRDDEIAAATVSASGTGSGNLIADACVEQSCDAVEKSTSARRDEAWASGRINSRRA